MEACRHIVREDRLLPWAEDLFARLARMQPESFRESIKSKQAGRTANGDTLASTEARIARLGQRFEWGHISEVEYQFEWARLHAVRSQLADDTQRRQTLRLDGVRGAWLTGDPVTRRDLLSTLFDEIDVDAGQIIAVKPRSDRVAEVAGLLEEAYSSSALAEAQSLLRVGRERSQPTPNKPRIRV